MGHMCHEVTATAMYVKKEKRATFHQQRSGNKTYRAKGAACLIFCPIAAAIDVNHSWCKNDCCS